MKFFLFLSLLFFLFIAQIGVLPHFLVLGLSPNIMLVSAFIFAFFTMDYRELMIFSFLAGFLLDVYSGVPFGIVLLSFILSVVLVDFLAYNFLGRDNVFVVCVGAAFGSVSYFIIYFNILKLYEFFKVFPETGLGVAQFSKIAIFSVILNILGVVILYFPLKKFIKFTDNFIR